jgi:hypothetical protein
MAKKGFVAKFVGKPATPAPGRPSALLDTLVVYCGDNLEQRAKPSLSLSNGLPGTSVGLINIDPVDSFEGRYDMNKKILLPALFVIFSGIAWLAYAQTPRQAVAPNARWQYATMYLLADANGTPQWTILFPDGRIARGEKVADVAKQLSLPSAQEGTLGMYNLMGAMGYELVMETKQSDGMSPANTIFKRPD